MYLLFDIGGTKTRISVSTDGKSCEDPIIVGTPNDFKEGVQTFVDTAEELLAGRKPDAIGGGVAGSLDRKKGVVIDSPHLPNWNNKPLAEEISSAFSGVPVYLENDTAIVGLGEACRGAGSGYRTVVYVTVSTGVNGALIVDGKIASSAMGFEIGRQIIDVDSTVCPSCKTPGTLENLISGSAVRVRTGKDPKEVSGDSPMWDEIASLLAVGLHNTIVHWSPNVVILGGSMMVGSPCISIGLVRSHLEKTLTFFENLPEIKKAECGAVGGIYGALEYLKQRVK